MPSSSHLVLTVLQGSWAAWTPDGEVPIALSRAEVLALGGQEADDAVLQKLEQEGLLVAEGTARPFRTEVVELPASDGGGLGLGAGLRLNRHLALQPTPGGFTAYSVRKRKRYRLPATLAADLVEPGEPSDGGADPSQDPLVSALLEAGILVRRDAVPEPAIRKKEGVVFARYASRDIPKAIRSRDAGADLAGRIPVYFAGCIDLSNDMGYGYLNLALGALMASIRAWQGGALTQRYFLVPDFLLSPAAVQAAVAKYGPGVVLFSNYIWATEGNLKAAKAIKELDPRVVTVFGGPNAPSYPAVAERYLREHPYIDVLARGEGEETAADLLDHVAWNGREPDTSALTEVGGLTFLSADTGSVVRTTDRARILDINALPSPYLTGEFDQVPRQILYGATLETNRGCPYGCTFCDWGSATRQKIRQFDMERVEAELDWMGRAGISVLFVADANFGIFDRDIQIAEKIAETARSHGALKQVITNYAKNATSNLTEILKIFVRAGLASEGVISVQTRDADTLEAVKRKNIKTRRYDELLDVFRSERLPLSTDLMIGLPGATPDSFKADLQHYFDAGVLAKAYRTRLLVNSPMADPAYMERYGIQTDDRGFLTASNSYTEQDLNYMLDLFGMYSLSICYGLFKHLLFWAQHRSGREAIELTDLLLRDVKASPNQYPLLTWCLGFLDGQRHSPGGWLPVLEEVAGFLERSIGLPWDQETDTILAAHEAVLADPDKPGDVDLELPHDVVAWFRAGGEKPLSEYGPGVLVVRDPHGLCRVDPTRHYQYGTHASVWELESELNQSHRPAFFLELDAITGLAWPRRAMVGRRAW